MPRRAPPRPSSKISAKIQNPRTKTPILCSKSPKTGVSKAKSAQKPRFCARNARKRGFRRAKKHKNLDFVLETPENVGSEGQKRTKTSILCSKRLKMRVPKAKKAQKPRFCARKDRDWYREIRPWPCDSLITHRIPSPRPGDSLIRRSYGGGVGNRCRWAERFAFV